MTHTAQIPPAVLQNAAQSAFVATTLRLENPSSDLLVRQVRLLRDCVALAQQRWGFGIEAAVVLPSELHLLCAFPDAEFGVRGALQLIMSAFQRHAPGVEKGIWSDECEMIEIDAGVVNLRRTFVETVPVRAGLVKRAEDWPFSSAHRRSAQANELGVAVA